MKRLNRKIKITLFVFLSIFSFLINAVAFYILSDYNSKHYMALSRSHMEQQYQNCLQRLAVLGEQIRLFGDNPQFTNGIAKKDWQMVSGKLADFMQSSGNIASLQIYNYDDGTLKFARGDSNMRFPELEPEKVAGVWEETADGEQSAVWFLREGPAGRYECLSFLMPVTDSGVKLGYLVADVSVVPFMQDILEEGGASLWEESIAIVSPEGIWISGRQPADGLEELAAAGNVESRVLDGKMVSVREITQSRDQLIQIISLKTGELLLPVGGMLFVVFLASLIVIYFGVKYITRSITVPLENLNAKMKGTMQEGS